MTNSRNAAPRWHLFWARLWVDFLELRPVVWFCNRFLDSGFSCYRCGSCGEAGCLCGSECDEGRGCHYRGIREETIEAIKDGWCASTYRGEPAEAVLARMEGK
jgi:hypothetical protein